jgi:hypothetical protein
VSCVYEYSVLSAVYRNKFGRDGSVSPDMEERTQKQMKF